MKCLFLAIWILILATSNLCAQTPYYQGKTIRLIVGSSAGSTYDGYMRLIAQYWGKHIPGNPTFVGQNMPGAGSQIAANYVYSAAKPDGLTLASVIPALYFNQLAGKKEVKFDWAKFTFIGSPDRSLNLLYIRADTPFKTIHDLRNASEPPKCSATGTGTVGHYFPRLLDETIGTKFAVVTGYQGGPEMDLALERNEVQCRALISELMDEYKTPEAGRRLARVVLASGELGRPYLGPPGLPEEVAKVLRESFAKMTKDPEFLADAKKRNMDIEFTPAEELESLSKEVVQQPPEVIQRVTKLLAK
jgi:tripartite-type tricarboxylate transporter receptor subunit TctC